MNRAGSSHGGLYLPSTAIQKGDLPALVSLSDTSGSYSDPGQHDKLPVLNQNLAGRATFQTLRCFTQADLSGT